ncbi:[Fe-Fe] hydrogenase large subunit C-terminal domain-containing protein [Sphaerochaeta globosa]|uniref:Fe-S cluster domain protein n=1 Tax=Sphaerochaeta globosa (strain ATCC BAA-1886 / DSM 22777 / Buddy) TaxID=158189 RepID=F0RSK3_SPHGB|nr:[Fe-Fe] hydrogenase large subunit C-terminal domain-containing protein [Sphaerochaeta globosa]ADY14116.1 Fe-S cluster domain protein [Sphaerochaeta globosa str. Buddy]
MSNQLFHHALYIVESACKGCTHCMKRCPTQAIRIAKGKARIDNDLCIECGQCMAVCPNNAIAIEQDSLSQLEAFTTRVAIVPAVFFAQFDDSVTLSHICGALYALGFTHLYLAETGVDILGILEAEDQSTTLPLISNFCPSVQRLIQVRFPLLVNNLSTLRSPAQVTALFARSELKALFEGLGIFYFSPCAAKIAQFKTEGSEEHRLFDGIINFDTAYNLVCAYIAKHKGDADQKQHTFSFPDCTRKALRWSLVKGQSSHHTGRCLAVDEMHNVIEFLEILEDEQDTNLQFLELDACAEGCVGGILTVRNRFLATERIRHWSSTVPKQLSQDLCERIIEQKQAFLKNLNLEPVQALHVLGLDTDHSKALQKLRKAERILAYLPGIDCGLCGSPSCKALSEDIAKSQASIRQCAVLKLKSAKDLNSLARIWGERSTTADGLQDDQA